VARLDVKRIALSLSFPFIAELVGSYFTFSSIPVWYAGLTKPALSPPNWIFGPVWIVLYLLLGISLYYVWHKYLAVFVVHLAVNALWSYTFFGLRNPKLALAVILVLLGFIIYMIIKFYKVEKISSYLLVPYLIWILFAIYLNYKIVILNGF
jgi:tryptophan-rich sensory protein